MNPIHPEQLIGAWQLESFTISFSDDRPQQYPFGEKATGMICYTADGSLSAILSGEQRPSMSSQGMEKAQFSTEAEKAAAFDSYLSYAGRYRLEEDEVIHSIELAMNPAIVGTEQRRTVHYNNNTGLLTLSYNITAASGVIRHYQLCWTRRPTL